MKKILYVTITAILLISVYSFSQKTDEDINWNDCLEKYKSEWGKPCKGCTYNKDIYKVYFRNICDEKIDVLVSVQEQDGTWKCNYFTELVPNDTIEAHACKGSGKFLYWVKKAGDTEITFPTCSEVNETYKE